MYSSRSRPFHSSVFPCSREDPSPPPLTPQELGSLKPGCSWVRPVLPTWSRVLLLTGLTGPVLTEEGQTQSHQRDRGFGQRAFCRATLSGALVARVSQCDIDQDRVWRGSLVPRPTSVGLVALGTSVGCGRAVLAAHLPHAGPGLGMVPHSPTEHAARAGLASPVGVLGPSQDLQALKA